jgi:hypothetical protein
MDTFKFKITLDLHNAIQNLNYYDLLDPPCFSLPSTFKQSNFQFIFVQFCCYTYMYRICFGVVPWRL